MQPWLAVFVLVILGAGGPVLRLLDDGFGEWALVLGLLSAMWAILLRHRPRGFAGWLLVIGLASVAPLVTWSTLGRAPTIVAFAGVFTAWAASTVGEGIGEDESRQWAGLALAPLVAAQMVWFRTQSHMLSAALLVLAMLAAWAYRRWPTVSTGLEQAVRTTLVRIVSAIGMVLLFVLSALFLYLPGAVGAVVQRRSRRGRRPTYWTRRPDDVCRVESAADRPFMSASPEVRRRRHLVGVLVLTLVAVVSMTVVYRVRSSTREPSDSPQVQGSTPTEPNVFERGRSVRFSSLPAYRDVPFADALKAEQDRFTSGYLVPSTVGGYDVSDFSGVYTNVRGGRRRTVDAVGCSTCREYTVWLAGGSAAFGLGQRDTHTIASELVRVAGADGVTLHVINLGVPGWTLHQEIQKVRAHLEDAESPDLVVFYDGFNDVVGTVVDSAVSGVRPSEPALLQGDQILEFTEHDVDPSRAGTPTEMGLLAAGKYRAAQASVRDELAAAGVGVLHVFQPDALTSADQHEQIEAEYGYESLDIDFFDHALESASRDLQPDVVNLRHALDSGPPVFADLVHTNEVAARRIAELLYPMVKGLLQAE